MFLTKEQSDARLKSESNLANRFGTKIETKVIPSPGKNKPNLTKEERTEIAIRSRSGEKGKDIAREKGILPVTVSNIKTGKTQGIDEKQVSSTLDNIRDKALDRLMTSMGLITDDKLSGCSAKELSVIASNMSRVVDNTIPKTESNDRIQLVIYAPEMKQEKSFKIVEI